MNTIQHIFIDNTLMRIGDTQFVDYLCHAYVYLNAGAWRLQMEAWHQLLCRQTLRHAKISLRSVEESQWTARCFLDNPLYIARH